MQTIDARTPRGIQLHSGKHVILRARLVGDRDEVITLDMGGMIGSEVVFEKLDGDRFGRRYRAVELLGSDTLVIDTVRWQSGHRIPLP